MDPREMTDDELYEALKDADLADRFLESPQGKLIKKAANNIVDRAVQEFALNPDITKNLEKLVELRVIIKKYKYGLFEEINQLRTMGFLVWQELKTRQPESLIQEPQTSAQKGDVNG